MRGKETFYTHIFWLQPVVIFLRSKKIGIGFNNIFVGVYFELNNTQAVRFITVYFEKQFLGSHRV